jgi:hypothetical protein
MSGKDPRDIIIKPVVSEESGQAQAGGAGRTDHIEAVRDRAPEAVAA